MSKTKLTLYIDEKTNNLARRAANLSGKSISAMVKEFFIEKTRQTEKIEIAESVSKWIGIINSGKTYKELRDEHIADRLKKYEDIN